MATYVLLSGAWGGGWQWRGVAPLLRAAGHEVYAPTFTGLGERVHLASPDITLDTHVQDVLNVLAYEELRDVILLGYSYSGLVATAVAEHAPERLARVAYLDAFVPEDGQSFADILGPELMAYLVAVAQAHGDGWRIPHDPPDAPLRTPHPLGTLSGEVALGNPVAAALPRAYIACAGNAADWPFTPILRGTAERARAAGWHYRELATGHVPWETAPEELAGLLLDLA